VSRDKQTALPEFPQYFTKPATSIIGHGADIRYDERVTRRLDYEVELAVVIGRSGRDIPAEKAYEHIFGSGVGYAMNPRRWLAVGDSITCRIERVGTLTNRVASAADAVKPGER